MVADTRETEVALQQWIQLLVPNQKLNNQEIKIELHHLVLVCTIINDTNFMHCY